MGKDRGYIPLYITNNATAFVTEEEARALVNYCSVALIEEEFIVELGTFSGGTTKILASSTRATVVTVDNYVGAYDPLDIQKDLEPWKNIIQIVGDSAKIGRLWKSKIRFLFVDAGHRYDEVLEDSIAWEPHLEPGAVVAYHDAVETIPIVRALNGRGVGVEPGPQLLVKQKIDSGDWELLETAGTIAFLRKIEKWRKE
jgi:hypothetical protein